VGSHEGVEGHDVGAAPVALHLVKQARRQVGARCTLGCADEGSVGDDIALAAPADHVFKHSYRLIHLQAQRGAEGGA
jgi:hypothetical protein